MSTYNLNHLKDEVYEWSCENFGEDQPYQYPLLGLMEEFGELITSVLKRRQGIDDNEKYDDLGDEYEMDAIGDMMVYLADFVARFPEEIDMEAQEYRHGDRDFDNELEVVWEVGGEIGNLFKHESHNAESGHYQLAVSWLIEDLEYFCEQRGFTLDECIEEAWGEVQERVWDSNVQQVLDQNSTADEL